MISNLYCPNPRRVAAGKFNRSKRQGLTAAGRERLRQAALAQRPWQFSTGPRTSPGKAQAATNGKVRQQGVLSVRDRRRLVSDCTVLVTDMAVTRRQAAELLAGT